MRVRYFYTMSVDLEVKKGEVPDDVWMDIDLGDIKHDKRVLSYGYGDTTSVIKIEIKNNQNDIKEINPSEAI